jgi:enamine deaminase RidA (YjgF/YER057c/UK114 family)
MARQSYNSKHLATPVGPFSHACHSSDLIFLSGQVGQHPQTGKLVEAADLRISKPPMTDGT